MGRFIQKRLLKSIIAIGLVFALTFSSMTPTDITSVWAADTTTRVYFTDRGGWSNISIYAYNGSLDSPTVYVSNTSMTLGDSAKKRYYYDVTTSDVDSFKVIISGNGGTDKFEATVPVGTTKYLSQYDVAVDSEGNGNLIDAAYPAYDNGVYNNTNESGTLDGNGLGGLYNSGVYAVYYLNFEQPATKIMLRASTISDAEKSANIYIDTKDSTPDCTVSLKENQNGWSNYKWFEADVSVPAGEHKVFIEFVKEDGAGYICNLDDICFNKYDYPTSLGKTVTVNGVSDNYIARNAVDGKSSTMWKSNSNGGWIYLDLQDICELDNITIELNKIYNKAFEIQISGDADIWTTIDRITASENNQTIYSIENNEIGKSLGKARYVRIKADDDWTEALAVNEITLNATRQSSAYTNVTHLFIVDEYNASTQTDSGEAKYAIDGKLDTSWIATDTNPEYVVDLNTTYEISSYDLTFGSDYANGFSVYYSEDGQVWNKINSVTGWNEPEGSSNGKYNYSYNFDATNAKYIKFIADSLVNQNSFELVDFTVWGIDKAKSSYWRNVGNTPIGVYQVTKLQNTNRPGAYEDETIEAGTDEDGNTIYEPLYPSGKIDSTLVSGDIIKNAQEYEIIYDANNRDIFFYLNNRGTIIDHSTQTVFWSCGDQGIPAYGAPHHQESIAKYIDKQQATVQYQLAENLDFGGEDYITTDIGVKVYNNTDIDENTNMPTETATPTFTLYFTLKIVNARNLYIGDEIEKNGTLRVKNASSALNYVWEKSKDGDTGWEVVAEKKNDITVITDNGAVINVANDLGGGYYYRVREEGQSVYSAPYQVKYYSVIKNGGFEIPAQCSPEDEDYNFPYNGNGDEQQFPNGFEGLYWKTTGPGWDTTYAAANRNMATHDIEIINGRWLKTENNKSRVNGFSVGALQMYGDTSHGDQFAELNCEAIGSLYQDLLTTPGSKCQWDLDHAGRWQQNEMYVISMASSDASTYFITEESIEALKEELEAYDIADNNTSETEYAEGVSVTVCARDGDGNMINQSGEVVNDSAEAKMIEAVVWMVQSPSSAGVWAHHKGKYTVPLGDKNNLTRLFFISKTYSGGNKTVGNLLDNVEFEQRKEYTINYLVYEYGEYVLKHTTSGTTVPYGRVTIPSTISEVNLSSYTLTKSTINKYERDDAGNIVYEDGNPKTYETPYYITEDRMLTTSYDHDTINLYYRSGVVTITEIVKGVSELPDDYMIKVEILDSSSAVKHTQILEKADFSPIENADGSAVNSYFVTYIVEASEANLSSGQTYTIKESNVQSVIDTEAYLGNIEIYHGSSTAGEADQKKELSSSELELNMQTYEDRTFVYNSSSENAETIVNNYVPAHTVTVENKVTGNMGNNDNKKKFNYTVTVTKDGVPIDAIMLGDSVEASFEGTGVYKFSLKNKESLDFIVYDGCVVTVVEEAEDYFSTEFTVRDTGDSKDTDYADNDRLFESGSYVSKPEDEDVDATVTTTSLVADSIGDIVILSINDNEDLGDVEVQGFQMNTNMDTGSPSQYSPSFRVVCRVSKNTIHRRRVVKAGVIFGTAAVVNADKDGVVPESKSEQRDNAEKNLVFNSDKILDNNENVGSEIKDGACQLTDDIFFHEETEAGYYKDYTTAADDEHPATQWNYFALTFRANSYMYGMFNQVITYRAYAVVEGTADNHDYEEDGKYYKYEYGNDIYTISMYEIAEDLYTKKKMTSQKAHNFLYNNILNIVQMDNNRLDIAKAMMKSLGVSKTSERNYQLINTWYKCAYDYVRCLRTYSYAKRNETISVPNADFEIKEFEVSGSTPEECNTELLSALNSSTDTEYDSISEWIYYEVDKIEKGTSGTYYGGYYKIVPYTYDDSLVTDYDKE